MKTKTVKSTTAAAKAAITTEEPDVEETAEAQTKPETLTSLISTAPSGTGFILFFERA